MGKKDIFFKLHTKVKLYPQRARWSLTAFFLLAWLPYYLSFFPGIVTHDEMLCIAQVLGDLPLSNHQPILFVFYLKIIISVVTAMGGSLNVAVAVATGLQMVFISVILSFVAQFVIVRSSKCWFGSIIILYFAFSPIIALYSIVLGKDTFFTGWLMIFVHQIYQIAVEGFTLKKNIRRQVGFTFIAFMVAMSRGNGLYILILMLAVLCVVIKENRKQLLFIGMTVIVCVEVIKGPVFDVLYISKTSVAESFSIPLQQIGYTLSKGGQIGEEDLAYLNEILPINDWKDSYTVGVADTLKFHENFKRSYLDETAGKFLEVWARNLLPNIKYYVQAYLGQIRGYWDITYIVNVDNMHIADNSYGIVQMDCIEKVAGFSLKPVCTLLVLVARKLPIVNIITNQALLAFIYLVAWTVWMCKKQYRMAVTIMPFLFQWLTLLIAAPVSSELRYMLSFHFMLPFIIGMFYLPLIGEKIKIKGKRKNNG